MKFSEKINTVGPAANLKLSRDSIQNPCVSSVPFQRPDVSTNCAILTFRLFQFEKFKLAILGLHALITIGLTIALVAVIGNTTVL